MRLVHLTDPHLTSLADQSLWRVRGKRRLGYLSWKRKRRFRHLQETLARVTEAVRSESAAQILISGDLAQIGLPEEFAEARSWLEHLGSPDRVTLVPGNHDYYRADSWPAMQRCWGAYLGVPAGEPESLVPPPFPRVRCLQGSGAAVIVVGLCSAYAAPLLMADGRLGADQLSGLDEVLDAADGFRCVLLHHPPLPGMTAWRKALRDAHQLGRLLARHQPELVLHGHVHRNRAGPVVGGMRVFATGSASSAEPGRPASYRVFDVVETADGWSVIMRLKGLTEVGEPEVLEEDRWTVPLRRPASAR